MSIKRFLKEVANDVKFEKVCSVLFKMIFGTSFETVFSQSGDIQDWLKQNGLQEKAFLLIPMSEANRNCFFAKDGALCHFGSVRWEIEKWIELDEVPVYKWVQNEEGWFVFTQEIFDYVQCSFEDGGSITCFKDQDNGLWTVIIETPMNSYQPLNTLYYPYFHNTFKYENIEDTKSLIRRPYGSNW